MSPKIKMSDIHNDRDDDIIELSDEELKEIYEGGICLEEYLW